MGSMLLKPVNDIGYWPMCSMLLLKPVKDIGYWQVVLTSFLFISDYNTRELRWKTRPRSAKVPEGMYNASENIMCENVHV